MIEVDSTEVLSLFSKLSPKKQKQAYRNTLRKGAMILQKETKSQLKRTGIKGVSKKPKNANIRIPPFMIGIGDNDFLPIVKGKQCAKILTIF